MLPMEFSYEELVPDFELRGKAALLEGPLPPPPDSDLTQSNRIIRTDQPWSVYVRWVTKGNMSYAMAGNFFLQVHLEKMGEDEFKLMQGPVSEPFVTPSGPTSLHQYFKNLAFQPNSVPEGLYKVVVALTFRGSSGIPCPIAAVGEGPVIQFYKVGP